MEHEGLMIESMNPMDEDYKADAEEKESNAWRVLKEVRKELLRRGIEPETRTGTWDEDERAELLEEIKEEGLLCF